MDYFLIKGGKQMEERTVIMFLVALILIEGYWKAVERAIDGYVTTRPVDLVIGVTWAASVVWCSK